MSDIRPRLIQVAFFALLLEGQGVAQVAAVKCCISEGNVLRIGECLSGPDNTDVPPACGSIGTCVLGFDADIALMGEMCDPEDPEIPDDPRAVCRTWTTGNGVVTEQCVASANTDFSLFKTYDTDGDGDLDLRDMAVFQQIYRPLPKQDRGVTQVVSVKCCISESNLIRIGDCLSGPDNTNVRAVCGSIGTCVLGFSGDTTNMGELCNPRNPDIPDDPRAVCTSWTTESAPATQRCVAAPNTDFSLFDTYDADGDGDLDLRDIAAFQRAYRSVPKEVQSDARLVFVECCTPGAGGGSAQQRSYEAAATPCSVAGIPQPICTLGFSGPVEPGDYLYELCRPGPPSEIDESTCVSWSVESVPVAYVCEAVGACDYRCPEPTTP